MPPNSLAPTTSLSQAIDHIPQGIAVFDASLRLVTSNARYNSLLEVPEVLQKVGTPLFDIALYLGDRGDLGDGDAARLAIERINMLTSSPVTVTQRRGNGGQTLEFHSSRLPDGGLVIAFADVTARVKAERELERVNLSLEARVAERTAALTRVNTELESARAKADAANHDKTRFLAAASHDLLQPLNAARLYTSTLIERAKSTGLAELANSIEASLTAVEDIMSALLDISRIDSGALKPAPVPVAARDMLKRIEVEFGPMARERNITLRIVPSKSSVLVDRSHVGRIVQNLVSNAIKYTNPGGKVLVGLRRRGNRMRLDVIDTGIGFNKDQHRLLFAEFSRLERGARMAQGLGLGLSIVQRLVTALGLTMELDSSEGRGSRFSLFLPLTRTIRPTAEMGPAPAETNFGTLGLKVLCVDNERAIIEAMEGLLRHWGCDVRSALSLKQIDKERLLEGWYPDLVLMDYHLDQTSGLDAIEWLRHNVGGHLPAALVTADRSPAVRALAEERSIAVVTKPVKPAALRAAISGLANQSRSPGGRSS
ncbi:hybrid sensor histidine kinase/response regulator [Devosia sp. J2-20]|jgi:signal transduction histidine kinase|uniref:histidine kinase n=1 Tax=Devosia litorisediminis TaxID=2829817 RepID=A0A942E778_9HYPH|nr:MULTISPECIES: hybrid sensor histidine kinase/response regulator [Devosia]MBS3849523.1 hybrid sensor histidine kinase/response regulator [Devosia litorisediminis]MCZ4344462.1 hybrid sensor histidine kinase/response regulator [Devosia neptuniae]WDR00841.1 hybrid sensor histidine kinase/response regulator [Devosia sp. J2-20]|tara:strand:+ start:12124 stop:13746 length:1623 start_codon:yes stop_codon:yes gene_type:complete